LSNHIFLVVQAAGLVAGTACWAGFATDKTVKRIIIW
jgi:hypothetical protein